MRLTSRRVDRISRSVTKYFDANISRIVEAWSDRLRSTLTVRERVALAKHLQVKADVLNILDPTGDPEIDAVLEKIRADPVQMRLFDDLIELNETLEGTGDMKLRVNNTRTF
jgi:hypothetical protein